MSGRNGTASGTWWGFHRLQPAWADQMVARAGVGPGDLVVDIGAGDGALTAPLVRAGARVIAIELHPNRATTLRERFAGDDVVVVRADATDLRLPRMQFHVVANLPFATTTAVLRRLLAPGSRMIGARLILPTGAAERWSGHRAPGSGRWARDFRVTVGNAVPRHAFRPPPRGACAELVIARRAGRQAVASAASTARRT